MTPTTGRSRRSRRAVLAALALTLILPASALSTHGPPHYNTPSVDYVTLTPSAGAGDVIPLINSGEDPFGSGLFQGIPDGLGVVPGTGYIDIYVTHEQSHVPFGVGTDPKLADLEDASVSRVRVDLATRSVMDLAVDVIPDSAGFLRFCSAFMAGPAQGFDHYTFFVNEESNEDILGVPSGAPYGPDPALSGHRQAGYSAWLDTQTGEYDVIARLGRLNHENAVVVPATTWNEIAILTGDDTFNTPQVNGSQLYLYTAKDDDAVMRDKGQLWAFQVTADDGVSVDPYNAFNQANDFLDISMGEVFSGRFIHVPNDVARGGTDIAPQTALDSWSNANNVFQFIRVEDIDYDPTHPNVVYFTDTGSSVAADAVSGRMTSVGGTNQQGRIFRIELNAKDPRIVDSFTVLADGASVIDNASPATNKSMRRPDNIDVGANSIMVQEDQTGGAKVWRYDRTLGTWSHIATAVQTPAETSGILDVSPWFGSGWWALDVQSHVNLASFTQGPFTWVGPPSTATGTYSKRLEDGQLLLMYVPGS
jgi:hypothetical protein